MNERMNEQVDGRTDEVSLSVRPSARPFVPWMEFDTILSSMQREQLTLLLSRLRIRYHGAFQTLWTL